MNTETTPPLQAQSLELEASPKKRARPRKPEKTPEEKAAEKEAKKAAKKQEEYQLLPHWFHGKTDQDVVPGRVCLNGSGPVPSQIAFILPSPAPGEVYKASPFSSDQAKALFRLLYKVGFPSAEAYCTYAVKYAQKGSKKLTTADAKQCSRMLAEELEEVDPEIVVPCGALALFAVAGREYPITCCRGARMQLEVAGKRRTVIPVHSMDSVLHDAKYEPSTLRDLRLVKQTWCREVPPAPECRIDVVHTAEEMRQFADWLLSNPNGILMGLDCEWHGHNWQDPKRYLRTVQMGWDDGCVTILEVTSEGGKPLYDDFDGVMAQLKRVLESRNVAIVGQNISSDAEWLLSYGIDIRKSIVFDTMLAEYITNPAGPFGLEELAMKYTDYGRYCADVELWVKNHPSLCDSDDEDGFGWVPRDLLLPYGGADVDVLRPIMREQTKKLKELGMLSPRGDKGQYPSLFDTTMTMSDILLELELNGMPLDQSRLAELVKAYQDKKDEIYGKLVSMATALGMPEFNPRSTDSVRKMLFDVLKLQPVKTTGGDNWAEAMMNAQMDNDELDAISTDKATLEILQDKHPFVKTLLDLRRIDQPCKTWLRYKDDDGKPAGIPAVTWADGKLHPHFSPLTETGRLRTSSPNCQNFPKKAEGYLTHIFGEGNEPPDIRTIVVPRKPGWVMLEGDFCQAELFTMANLSQDENMIKALTTPGLDLHDKTAVDSFGLHMFDANGHEVSEDDLVALAAKLKDAGGADSDEFQHFMKELVYVDQQNERLTRAAFKSGIRVSAKSINFGIPYGRGAKAIALQIKAETGTTRSVEEIAAEIEEVLRKWKTVAYPTTWAWLQSCAQCVYDPGYLKNPWGRLKVAKIYKGERRADLERQFSNFPIQSTVADTVQIAMDKMRQYRDNTGLEFILQNQIHDAVMVECPLENVPAVKEMFHATMAAIDIPIPGSSKSFRLGVDIDVYERWGKKMKT